MNETTFTVTVSGGVVAYMGERDEDAYRCFFRVVLNQLVVEATLTRKMYHAGRLVDERSFQYNGAGFKITNLEAKR
jgi:hypothetical protein